MEAMDINKGDGRRLMYFFPFLPSIGFPDRIFLLIFLTRQWVSSSFIVLGRGVLLLFFGLPSFSVLLVQY